MNTTPVRADERFHSSLTCRWRRAFARRPGYIPLERLALSPQCGFASGEAGNPLTPEEQEAKLRLVAQVARRIWGT